MPARRRPSPPLLLVLGGSVLRGIRLLEISSLGYRPSSRLVEIVRDPYENSRGRRTRNFIARIKYARANWK